MKTNEDILVEANEALREELAKAREEASKRKLQPVVLSYTVLLTATVIGAIYATVLNESLFPLIFGVLLVGWIENRIRACRDAQHAGPQRAATETRGVRVVIDNEDVYAERAAPRQKRRREA